jgi:histone H3/H4
MLMTDEQPMTDFKSIFASPKPIMNKKKKQKVFKELEQKKEIEKEVEVSKEELEEEEEEITSGQKPFDELVPPQPEKTDDDESEVEPNYDSLKTADMIQQIQDKSEHQESKVKSIKKKGSKKGDIRVLKNLKRLKRMCFGKIEKAPIFKPAKNNKRKRSPGKLSLQEIRHYQSNTGLLIGRAPMKRLVREVISDFHKDVSFRIQSGAADALHIAAEDILIDLLRGANDIAVHSNRVTILPKDIEFSAKNLNLSVG